MIPPALKDAVRDGYRQLGQQLDGFVPRKEQNYLVAEIVKVLCGHYDRQRRLLVAEAGTGTGKSLAYLQAGIPCAKALDKKLVISTATLSLQEQLINKDLPGFQKISRTPFTFTLVKGRQRYCCEQRLARLAKAGPTETGEQLSFDELLSFKPTAADRQFFGQLWQAYVEGRWAGDRDSWPTPIEESRWNAIAADRFNCNRAFAHHRECPFHRARAKLDQVDVLVVNHALLLSDLALGGGVILPEPEQCFYILDEAHHLPTIARDQGAASAGVRGLRSWLEKLPPLADRVLKLVCRDGLISPREQLTDAVQELLHDNRQLELWLEQQPHWFEAEPVHRFTMGELPEPLPVLAVNLKDAGGRALRALDKLQQAVGEAMKEGQVRQREAEALLGELSIAMHRLEQVATLWRLMSQDDRQVPLAKWLELGQEPRDWLLHASPLEMGGWLEQVLWSRCAGAVLVSATLTAMNSFRFFRHQAGLREGDGTQYLRLQSPFDFQRAELYIPAMPCDPASPDFTQALIDKLPGLLAGQQASLVLFSSYRQMQEVAEGLRSRHGLSLLVQGEASREALLGLHHSRCDGRQPSILLGTGSFAEGLDLPGHYLTNLIITKLPFSVPTSPLEAATAEWIERQGGNPFLQITVPEASRKLIQACGRLIRKEQDQGRICLLDRRILTKQYGKGLLAALPPFRRHIEPD